jgi:hypothetical protein
MISLTDNQIALLTYSPIPASVKLYHSGELAPVAQFTS